MDIAILILGAGSSSRMRGGDKLLEDVEGKPLLSCLAERALATGAEVAVTLPSNAPARRAALEGLAVRLIDVPEAAEGMSASLRRGAKAFAGSEAMIVLPGDMPEIQTGDLVSMIDTFRTAPDAPILRATDDTGMPGHPVLFPKRFLVEFADLQGDRGAAEILKAHANEVRLLPLPGKRATTDLDSPEAWEAWRRPRA